MKAIIFINGQEIFNSCKISSKNLEKVEHQIKEKHGCLKMTNQVKKGYKLFTS